MPSSDEKLGNCQLVAKKKNTQKTNKKTTALLLEQLTQYAATCTIWNPKSLHQLKYQQARTDAEVSSMVYNQ